MVFLGLLLGVALEIIAYVLVAQQIGFLLALAILIGMSAIGPFIVRRVGLGVLANAQARLEVGELPTRELLDGALTLVGGMLICLPGFVSDAIGLLLMFKPVRHLAIRVGGYRVAQGITIIRFGRGRVIDASSHPTDAHRPPPPEIPERSLDPGEDPPTPT